MKTYIDAEQLSEKIKSIGLYAQKSADYNDGHNDMKMMVLDLIDSLQQELTFDTDALHTELIKLLKPYRIWEETARMMADRIADTYGVQRYMDGLCDGVKQEQLEVDLKKEIKNYLTTECADDDEPSVSEIARHFYELGLNARK